MKLKILTDEEINFHKHLYTDHRHEHFIYDFKGVAEAQRLSDEKQALEQMIEWINELDNGLNSAGRWRQRVRELRQSFKDKLDIPPAL